jgi:hypothetical protein
MSRWVLLSTLAVTSSHVGAVSFCLGTGADYASSGSLPSWNDGTAKQTILDFVRDTTVPATPKLVSPQERIAMFDQDGTLW